jgi:hypothetical protein
VLWRHLLQKSSVLQGPAIVGARLPPSPFSRFILRSEEIFSFEIWSKTPSVLRQIMASDSRALLHLGVCWRVERILCFATRLSKETFLTLVTQDEQEDRVKIAFSAWSSSGEAETENLK